MPPHVARCAGPLTLKMRRRFLPLRAPPGAHRRPFGEARTQSGEYYSLIRVFKIITIMIKRSLRHPSTNKLCQRAAGLMRCADGRRISFHVLPYIPSKCYFRSEACTSLSFFPLFFSPPPPPISVPAGRSRLKERRHGEREDGEACVWRRGRSSRDEPKERNEVPEKGSQTGLWLLSDPHECIKTS